MKEGEEVVIRPFEEKLVREAWFGAIIDRLTPIVGSRAEPGVSITKTDAMWLFEITGFAEIEARIAALETRLNNAKVQARFENGTWIVNFSI